MDLNNGPQTSSTPAPIGVLCKDLLFRTKIRESASALGVALEMFRSIEGIEEYLRKGGALQMLVADLGEGVVNPEALLEKLHAATSHKIPTYGFLPHGERETIERALAAGFSEVYARSQFVRILPELLQKGK